MLGLGTNKGLHGVGLFVANPSAIIAKTAIRQLADFKGKKLRIFTSDFQSVALQRLGAMPIAMTLGDVLPAIQQGAIDGAIAAVPVYTTMQFWDAAKYVTETGQPFIFIIVEVSKKWYDSLPQNLQAIIDADAVREATAINPWAMDFYGKARTNWVAKGGELISLPADEQAAMMESLASVAADVSKPKPELNAAYELVSGVAKRTR
jgi:TRAP-type C4-dicarboxylate transport system substrate-binding protein